MDRLQAMRVFSKVVETNSFSRAADSLNLPRASVTVIVKGLEEALRIRLLHRTTRALSLTPEGALYYERCIRVLADIDEMEATLTQATGTPRGKLRVDLPNTIGKFVLVPALDDFCSSYPDIELTVGFGDKHVDLVRDGVDCAIRVGALADSSLVARRLTSLAMITVSSPGYIDRQGMPGCVGDLNDHLCIRYHATGAAPTSDMTFLVGGKETQVKLKPGLIVGDLEAQLSCAVQGLGIAQVPTFMATPYLRAGGLVEVLPDVPPPSAPVSVTYPQNRHLSVNVRTFVEWAAQRFEQAAVLKDVLPRAGQPKSTDLRVAA
ncbi:LysR family transcriptional regulator [Paraburkholderia fungorum]|uniref:LysR family transcriptional regulator n=1 Tax=Paraburkholderia fungorum TaxID=134537 RepID=UPI00402B208B